MQAVVSGLEPASNLQSLAFAGATPDSMIKGLLKKPLLKECYGKNSNISANGVSSLEHTKIALKTASEFREGLFKNIEHLVSWDEFLLFLALFDIGKGVARNHQTSSFAPAIPYKDIGTNTPDQTAFINVMERLGLSPEKIRVFWEMLTYDTLTLYLKGDIDHDEALDNVLEMAKNCRMDPQDFYQLFETIHRVLAVSDPTSKDHFGVRGGKIDYPPEKATKLAASLELTSRVSRLFSCFVYGFSTVTSAVLWTVDLIRKPSLIRINADQEKIDRVVTSLYQAKVGEKVYTECLKSIKKYEDPKKIEPYFKKHIQEMKMFVERMHKQMLKSTGNFTSEEQEIYRQIKKGFRDILLAFYRSTTPNEFKNSLGRDFLTALRRFRNDYLCRFSISKIKSNIQEEYDRRQRNELIQAEQGQKVFRSILERTEAKEDPAILKELIFENLQKIKAFIEHEHKHILRSADNLQPRQSERCEQIKQDLRIILLYSGLVESETAFEDFVKGELHYIKHHYRLRAIVTDFKNFCEDYEVLSDDQKIRSDALKTRIKNANEVLNLDDNALSLFPLTFIHGTNSAILPNLPRTAFHLVSFGRLSRSGIIPLSGELASGIEDGCINQYKLSGVSVAEGKVACSYANKGEKLDEQASEELLIRIKDNLRKDIEKGVLLFDRLTGDESISWNNYSVRILQIKALFPDIFYKHKAELAEAANKFDLEWKRFKTSQLYWWKMPTDRFGLLGPKFWNRLGYFTIDYSDIFRKAEVAIENLKKASQEETNPQDSVRVENSYPLLFASKTMHTVKLVGTQLEESLAHKACLLGRDIQTIFVDRKNGEHLFSFLKEHRLSDKVTLIERKHFEEATKLHELASDYLNDVVSRKKINSTIFDY